MEIREEREGVRVYNFAPFLKEGGERIFFMVGEVYGLMDIEGRYYEKRDVREVLSFLEKFENVSLLSFGGMIRDFHVFKGHCKLLPQGRWTVRIGKFYGFDLMGYASFTGHLSLESWAKDWGVEYEDSLRGRLNALRGLYLKLKEIGADYTPGRTARKVVMEWLSKPVVSYMPERLELVGGRSQIFYHYAEDVHVYDFNSMYPSVMAYTKLPLLIDKKNLYVQVVMKVEEERVRNYVDGLGPVWEKFTLESPPKIENVMYLNNLMREYYFLKVRIKGFSLGLRPPFPFAGWYKGKRSFMYLEGGEYYVSGYEVPLLHGYEYEVISAYMSFSDYLPFADKVVRAYEKRQESRAKGNKIGTGYYKAVLNAIFGVFGIKQKHGAKEKSMVLSKKEVKEKLKGAVYVEGDEYGNVSVYRYRQGSRKILVFDSGRDEYLVVERLDEEDYINTSIPALAVGIPANGRFLLLWLMKYLISKGHKVYYCDTDSVHTSCPPEKMKELLGEGMLQLKHEGHYDKVYYFAPKTYYMEKNRKGVLVAKGVRDFEDEIVIYSFSSKEPRVVIRRAIDPESVPLTVSGENYVAVLNTEGKKFKDTPMYEVYQKLQEKKSSQRRMTD